MASQALQELVKKFFGDEQVKCEFMTDPESVISRYDLTEQEKMLLISTHTELGWVTGNSK
jgi:hypothetical protein